MIDKVELDGKIKKNSKDKVKQDLMTILDDRKYLTIVLDNKLAQISEAFHYPFYWPQ